MDLRPGRSGGPQQAELPPTLPHREQQGVDHTHERLQQGEQEHPLDDPLEATEQLRPLVHELRRLEHVGDPVGGGQVHHRLPGPGRVRVEPDQRCEVRGGGHLAQHHAAVDHTVADERTTSTEHAGDLEELGATAGEHHRQPVPRRHAGVDRRPLGQEDRVGAQPRGCRSDEVEADHVERRVGVEARHAQRRGAGGPPGQLPPGAGLHTRHALEVAEQLGGQPAPGERPGVHHQIGLHRPVHLCLERGHERRQADRQGHDHCGRHGERTRGGGRPRAAASDVTGGDPPQRARRDRQHTDATGDHGRQRHGREPQQEHHDPRDRGSCRRQRGLAPLDEEDEHGAGRQHRRHERRADRGEERRTGGHRGVVDRLDGRHPAHTPSGQDGGGDRGGHTDHDGPAERSPGDDRARHRDRAPELGEDPLDPLTDEESQRCADERRHQGEHAGLEERCGQELARPGTHETERGEGPTPLGVQQRERVGDRHHAHQQRQPGEPDEQGPHQGEAAGQSVLPVRRRGLGVDQFHPRRQRRPDLLGDLLRVGTLLDGDAEPVVVEGPVEQVAGLGRRQEREARTGRQATLTRGHDPGDPVVADAVATDHRDLVADPELTCLGRPLVDHDVTRTGGWTALDQCVGRLGRAGGPVRSEGLLGQARRHHRATVGTQDDRHVLDARRHGGDTRDRPHAVGHRRRDQPTDLLQRRLVRDLTLDDEVLRPHTGLGQGLQSRADAVEQRQRPGEVPHAERDRHGREQESTALPEQRLQRPPDAPTGPPPGTAGHVTTVGHGAWSWKGGMSRPPPA